MRACTWQTRDERRTAQHLSRFSASRKCVATSVSSFRRRPCFWIMFGSCPVRGKDPSLHRPLHPSPSAHGREGTWSRAGHDTPSHTAHTDARIGILEEHGGRTCVCARARVCVRALFVCASHRATASSSNCSMTSSAISYLRNLPVSPSHENRPEPWCVGRGAHACCGLPTARFKAATFGRTAIPAAPPIAGSRGNILPPDARYTHQAWME